MCFVGNTQGIFGAKRDDKILYLPQPLLFLVGTDDKVAHFLSTLHPLLREPAWVSTDCSGAATAETMLVIIDVARSRGRADHYGSRTLNFFFFVFDGCAF